jgi:hypothetical protein
MAGYPALRVMTLAETGTRGLLGAMVGSVSDRDEVGLARRLLPLLGPGMVILLDRAFDAAAFLAEITATGAMLLARPGPPASRRSWPTCPTAPICRGWTARMARRDSGCGSSKPAWS